MTKEQVKVKTITINISCPNMLIIRYFTISEEAQENVLRKVEQVKKGKMTKGELYNYLCFESGNRGDLYENDCIPENQYIKVEVVDENDSTLYCKEISATEIHNHSFFESAERNGEYTTKFTGFPKNFDGLSGYDKDFLARISKCDPQDDICYDADDAQLCLYLGCMNPKEVADKNQMWWRAIAIGEGFMTYEIKIPDDDEFDIRKLEWVGACEILHSELYNKGYEYYDIGPEEYVIPAIEIFYDGNLYEGELADGQWELKEVSVLKPIEKLVFHSEVE